MPNEVQRGRPRALPSGPHSELGLTIKRARERKGLTQSMLARELGVDRSTVGVWETGRQFPGRKAGAIEAILGITIPARPAA